MLWELGEVVLQAGIPDLVWANHSQMVLDPSRGLARLERKVEDRL